MLTLEFSLSQKQLSTLLLLLLLSSFYCHNCNNDRNNIIIIEIVITTPIYYFPVPTIVIIIINIVFIIISLPNLLLCWLFQPLVPLGQSLFNVLSELNQIGTFNTSFVCWLSLIFVTVRFASLSRHSVYNMQYKSVSIPFSQVNDNST